MNKIGKYDLVRELGRGSTARVFLAYDAFAQREVAVKVALPEALRHPEKGPLYTRAFMTEAALAGKLAHPHIVQIYDAVVDDNQCYVVMEYVKGGKLDEFCAPTHLLPIERVTEIIFKCSRALEFAHRIGITHRDIKPANILYSGADPLTGEIKISDFGAALVDFVDRTQISGIGSPAYMSPEQIREQAVDHRTDIYSLGIVMYQMLTGHLPFQSSSNINMIYQVLHVDALRPSMLRPEIPEALDLIIHQATHKEPSMRYASWDHFSRDLAQVFRNRSLTQTTQQLADSEKFDTLRRFNFFDRFNDVELWETLRLSDWKQVSVGEYIVRDGEQGQTFCFLAEGRLKVSKRGRVLGLLNAGDCFGEMAVIGKTHDTRGADVMALSPCKIVMIDNAALKKASDTCRMHFYESFLEVLSERLSQANARLSTL